MTTEILFYSRDDKYGFLSNFERSQQTGKDYEDPQITDDRLYPTNEHYYQSQKANSEAMRDWIASAPTPYAAMMAGRNLRKKEIVKSWEDIKTKVMLNGLRSKFTDNGRLRIRLIETDDAILHENSPTDMFWGIKGKDMLGKILMQVREEMKLLPPYREENHGE